MASERQTGEPLKGGNEHDAFSRWRKVMIWRPGQRASAKRTFNRRVRRQTIEGWDD